MPAPPISPRLILAARDFANLPPYSPRKTSHGRRADRRRISTFSAQDRASEEPEPRLNDATHPLETFMGSMAPTALSKQDDESDLTLSGEEDDGAIRTKAALRTQEVELSKEEVHVCHILASLKAPPLLTRDQELELQLVSAKKELERYKEALAESEARLKSTIKPPLLLTREVQLELQLVQTKRELERHKQALSASEEALSASEQALSASEARLESIRNAARARNTCPICLSYYIAPLCLPCGHAFCAECLSEHAEVRAKNGRNMACPKCRNLTGEESPYKCYGIRDDVADMLEDMGQVVPPEPAFTWPWQFCTPVKPLPFPEDGEYDADEEDGDEDVDDDEQYEDDEQYDDDDEYEDEEHNEDNENEERN
ncbi:hypothetical protein EV360DRAFT_75688 [Lentinula raphanica]|nr:hypothetical protein EV360DRAFT_75688 [Lentinula raphanica]